MCGRTCLTLEPKEILKACKYRRNGGNKNSEKDEVNKVDTNNECHLIEPEWRCEFNCGRKYTPSFNLAPTDVTPVLISNSHFIDDAHNLNNKRILMPMMWGIIPYWHKGDYRKHRLSTNNCRLENIEASKLYSPAFKKGQRCVVLCEGFYEWQTTKSASASGRAAYFIYMPQEENVKVYDKKTWTPENINLLKMAGLFDIWMDAFGDKMYSYSIITRESNGTISNIHHRMPIILETEQEVNAWLDAKATPHLGNLEWLNQCVKLNWHRVSNLVNNSSNKSDECNKPFEMANTSNNHSNELITKWLTVGKRKSEKIISTNVSESQVVKRPKMPS